MVSKKILFISWEGGMGHITRDVAIAAELRRQRPDIELSWLASPMASRVLDEEREALLPESSLSVDYNAVGEKALGEFSVNILKFVLYCGKAWARNVRLFTDVIAKYDFDLIIGDESYEVLMALDSGKTEIRCPFIMIHDLIGVTAMSWNPLERLLSYWQNWKWARFKTQDRTILNFFVGEPEDVPDEKFGWLLRNKRDWAVANCKFLGYVIRFDPEQYQDKEAVRADLGYDKRPLVICALGGSSAGKELLELCGRSLPLVKRHIPSIRMVMVCGTRLSGKSLDLPEGIDVREYIPNLYQHFAASDLAVIVGGGTSVTELTALKTPFFYFPLEKQFEQQILIPHRLSRHRAGIRMDYRQTTPEILAEQILANIGTEAQFAPIPVDGAQQAVRYISQLI